MIIRTLPPLKRLARTLRRYYASLGGVCIAAGVMMNDVEGFPNPFELSTLDGVTGFTIFGTRADLAGRFVSDAGDLNGDGVADIVIGGGTDRSWVVFGRLENDFLSLQELSSLDGNNGFTLQGNPEDLAGFSVSGAGDINHDGMDDLIIGAPEADVNGSDSGQSYVVFGRNQGFSATLILSTLDGTNGFTLNGVNAGDSSGFSVSDAGDVNGDDLNDLAILASGGGSKTHIIFGTRADLTLSIDDSIDPVDLNTSLNYTITITNQGPTYTSSVEVVFDFPATLNFMDSPS